MSVHRIDDESAFRALGKFAVYLRAFPKSYEKAVAGGLNIVGAKARKDVINVLSERYWASKGKINSRVEVFRARARRLSFLIAGKGRALTLGSFRTVPTTVTDKRGRARQGVMAAVLRENAPKLIQGGFLGKGLIFKRVGEERLPIRALYGPTLVGYFANEENLEPIKEGIAANMDEAMEKAATKELKKLGMI